MKKIISLFALISITFSLICCKDNTSTAASNSDSSSKSPNDKKAAVDSQQHPALSFDTIYVGINELKKYGPNILFQLKNIKEGSKDDDHSKRHRYVLIGGYYTGTDFKPADDLIKNDSILKAGRIIHEIRIPDHGDGTDLKIGNYPFKFNKDSIPTGAIYMILAPTKSNYQDYISYKISFCNIKLDSIGTSQNKEYILPINPSPPAPPPF